MTGSAKQTSLPEIALLFLKLGTTAFGGPAAHIAMMKDEVVTRRKWLTETEFLDYLGATNLIPGPNSTEMAIHVGHHRRGWAGLIVAGATFILPAMFMVWAIAWAYMKFGSLPEVSGILYGIKPVVIAVVVQALWGLGRTALKTSFLAILSITSLLASAAGLNEIVIIFLAGFLAVIEKKVKLRSAAALPVLSLASIASTTKVLAGVKAVIPVSITKMFLIFLKIGSVLFGSGYVLLAFLRTDFVENLHWLTETQLLDATAVGQFTPGPVFTTATFIGYVLSGTSGAFVATLGIFLPAFLFVAISAPLIPRIRNSAVAGAFLDGVNVASLALMAFVAWELGRAAPVDLLTLSIAIITAVLLIRYKINSAWLVLGGGIAGYLRLTLL
jgi:chromate transporter